MGRHDLEYIDGMTAQMIGQRRRVVRQRVVDHMQRPPPQQCAEPACEAEVRSR